MHFLKQKLVFDFTRTIRKLNFMIHLSKDFNSVNYTENLITSTMVKM